MTARAVVASVTDPEMPMLTLEDLGVLRDVEERDGRVVVTITPTYSGCPAMATMRDDVVHRLQDNGFRDVEVRSKALTLTLPGPAEFLWQYVHSTPLAAAVAQIDDVGRAALERDVVAGWPSFVKDGTLVDDVNVVLTTARK